MREIKEKNGGNIKHFTIIRTYGTLEDEGTQGKLLDQNGKHIVFTLEPPQRNNAKDDPKTKDNEAGCIPEGIYKVKRRDPSKHKGAKYPDAWEILDVPNKSAILFHCGNLWTDSKSCPLVATTLQDMNPHNDTNFSFIKKWWASQSQAAMRVFEKQMPEEFDLKITSIQTLCNY